MSEPDWKARFFELRDAAELLSETSVYCSSESCQIPNSEAWDYLEKCSEHYSSEKAVRRLEVPDLQGGAK